MDNRQFKRKYLTGYTEFTKPHRLSHLTVTILSTLYTNIPHDALKNNVRILVCEAFKVRGARYLVVDKHVIAHWSQEPSTTTTCTNIDKSKLIEWTEYMMYRQTIGIPGYRLCTTVGQLVSIPFIHEGVDERQLTHKRFF